MLKEGLAAKEKSLNRGPCLPSTVVWVGEALYYQSWRLWDHRKVLWIVIKALGLFINLKMTKGHLNFLFGIFKLKTDSTLL